MKFRLSTSVAVAILAANAALAAEDPAEQQVAKASEERSAHTHHEKPAPQSSWLDTLTVTGYLDGGVAVNFANPFNRLNWGHLFTDRANTPQFNQGVLTVQRPLDPKEKGYDFGFKVQGLIGTDARYTHFLGELDYAIHDRTQLDIVEAYAVAHLPWFTANGIDVKVGQFVTLEGAEVITAPDNLFYTHSYIFNFGIPLKHTGVMVHADLTDWLLVHAGVTSGVNTSLGWPGDNNAGVSFHGGVGFNLLDGNLTVLATTHIGPENPKQLDPLGVGWPGGVVGGVPVACACKPSSTLRYINDITITWKATEDLTFITDLNYIRDDGWNLISVTGLPGGTLAAIDTRFGTNLSGLPNRPQGVEGYGVAQYASYKVNDVVKVNGRVEFWRDNKNFFVAGYPGYFDFANIQHGFFTPSAIFRPAGVGTSYLGLTAGLTITPEVPKNPFITGLILRPELRWDTSVNGTAPFFGPNGPKRSTGMFAMDVIVPFTIK
ncbi:outer membrane beta-barrel protein [Methylosinus sp. LW3]|uniref:outer membrane beta-barrel protein n=1 Tax=Methylosinus sp. LW3 TaxID=107635 RepID=UPI000463FC5D|nr:outer membrane beta-barrel protein [Methylosinus sp. LW3]